MEQSVLVYGEGACVNVSMLVCAYACAVIVDGCTFLWQVSRSSCFLSMLTIQCCCSVLRLSSNPGGQ